jgi:hypothetical protein
VVVRELDSAMTSQSKEWKSPLLVIPNTDRGRERHGSEHSYPELPLSIKLSPLPGDEASLSLKAPQKAKRTHPKKIVGGYVP